MCTPRQVRAGVPAILDAITYRALRGQAADAPLRAQTPAGLAMALRMVQRPSYQLDEAGWSRPPVQSSPPPVGPRGTARTGLWHRTTLLRPAVSAHGTAAITPAAVAPPRLGVSVPRQVVGHGSSRRPARPWIRPAACPGQLARRIRRLVGQLLDLVEDPPDRWCRGTSRRPGRSHQLRWPARRGRRPVRRAVRRPLVWFLLVSLWLLLPPAVRLPGLPPLAACPPSPPPAPADPTQT